MRRLLLRPLVMFTTFGFGLISVFAFGLLSKPPAESSPFPISSATIAHPKVPEDDARAVYIMAVIEDSQYKNSPVRVIEEMTNRGGTMMDEDIDAGSVPGAAAKTLASYKVNNENPTSLRGPLSALPKAVFWTKEDSKKTFREDDPDMSRFYKVYPKSRGIMSFSNIGFNKRHDQAMVYFSYFCGSLSAGGMFIVLEKKNGNWHVTRRNELWVS